MINDNIKSPFALRKNPLAQQPQLPLIVISREKGSGGRPIAYLVTKLLGNPWKIYHENIVDEIAQETTMERNAVKEVDEKMLSLSTQLLDSVLGKKYLTLNEYYKHLLHVLASIGNKGHAVIVGRGVNFLFPHSLKVRIVATMQTRIDWVMKYEKVSYKEAVKKIEESDKERYEFIKSLFQHDVRKPHHYDITIRTGDHMSVEAAAELIVSLAKKRFKI